MKKKLKIQEISVQSFVTEIKNEETQTLKGGAQTIDAGMCTALSCGIAACTRDILNCI